MNYDNELLELKVTQVVSSILSCRIIDVKVDTKLSYLGMDSLDRVELQMRCEDYFCVTIDDNDIKLELNIYNNLKIEFLANNIVVNFDTTFVYNKLIEYLNIK